MLILSQQRFRFQAGGETFITDRPDGKPQEAPDWIEHDPLFGLAVSAGKLAVVGQPPLLSVPSSVGESGPIPPATPEDEEDATPPLTTRTRKRN